MPCSTSLRVLRPEDLPAVNQVLSRDPVADVFVASRVQAVGLDPAREDARRHRVDREEPRDGPLVALVEDAGSGRAEHGAVRISSR